MNQHKTISLVVPFFNESESIEGFYTTLSPILNALSPIHFEIVCVDDGSADSTLEKLKQIAEKDPRFSILELSRNFGKEAALTAGLEFAQGDAVIPIDADLQDPPELIPQMIAEWEKGAEVVLMRRVDRSSDSYLKRKTAELFYRCHNHLSDIQLPENVGDFRLMDRVVIDALKQCQPDELSPKEALAFLYQCQAMVSGT